MISSAPAPASWDGIAYAPARAPSRAHFVALPRAEVLIAEADDGRWMWGCSYHDVRSGFGYAPLPKWGNFACTRDEAIQRGASELLARLLKMRGQKAAPEVIAWLQHELQPRRPVQGDLFA